MGVCKRCGQHPDSWDGYCKACLAEWSVWTGTTAVRNPDTPKLDQLREALEERGIDVATATIDFWPEDVELVQGVIVTSERTVVLFEYDWLHGANSIVRWEDITERADRWYPFGHVEAAFRILDSDRYGW